MVVPAACASIEQQSVQADFVPGASTSTGVVIGSVTSVPDVWHEMSTWTYESSASRKLRGVVTSAHPFNPHFIWGQIPKCAADGLEAECGRLFALELPVGDYRFTSVAVAQGAYAAVGPVLAGYDFAVEPGAVSYIGNLNSRICMAATSRHTNRNGIVAATGEVVERFERDWPLLVMKYPVLEGAEPTTALVSGRPWLWRAGAEDYWEPPYGWPDCAYLPGDTTH
jgi:hypothetical protein